MEIRPSISKTRGKALTSQGKRIIFNVISYFDKESLNEVPNLPIKQATKRASAATGFSETVIKKIRKEGKGEKNPVFKSARKRNKKRRGLYFLDNFDRSVIRRTVQDFYINGEVPSIAKLIPVLKEKINFSFGRESLRKILHEIGFFWKKSQNQRKLLIERNEIILKRARYLREIMRVRKEKIPLIYIDEISIDNNLTFRKCWQSQGFEQLVVLCAGGEMGFIPHTHSVYKTNTTMENYNGQMNSFIFEKWTSEKLLPNLPENAVIIIDNAPYHSIQVNKHPNSSFRKQEIMDWLSKNNIPFSEDLRKVELLELVRSNSLQTKIYKFDTMLEQKGFHVLRLPPYHYDINAVEYVWAELNKYIKNFNIENISMDRLFELANQGLSSINEENWKKYCAHVSNLEEEYWIKDAMMEDVCDPLMSTEDSDDETIYNSDETITTCEDDMDQ